MIRLIVFDFDGVIEDNYEEHFSLSQKQIKDLTREEHRKFFEGNIHEERAKLVDRFTGFDLPKQFDAHKETLRTTDDIKRTLQGLSENYTLGIISSGLEAGLNRYLENNGLRDIFSFVYGKDTHAKKKEKFEQVMRTQHVSNKEIVFVTDTLGDIREAQTVGISTIAVDFGFHERERLEKGKPVAIVSRFIDIPQAVRTLNDGIDANDQNRHSDA